MSQPGSNPSTIRSTVQILRAAAKEAIDTVNASIGSTLPCHVLSRYERRKMARPMSLPVGSLSYDPNDITVVGGAVLSLLDEGLQDIKEHYPTAIRSLRNELDRESPDIDLVWWPRTTLPEDQIVSSSSEYIQQIVQAVVEHLQRRMPDATVSHTHYAPSGVHSVGVTRANQKIVDLSLHDSGNSQRYTLYAAEIQGETPPMTEDPMYPMERIELYGHLHIPSLQVFFYQQLFAYSSFYRSGSNARKEVARRRIQYLMKWLQLLSQVHSVANLAQFKALTGVEDPSAEREQMQRVLKKFHVQANVSAFSSLPAASNEVTNAAANRVPHAVAAKAASSAAAANNEKKNNSLAASLRHLNINDLNLSRPITYVPKQASSQNHTKKKSSKKHKEEFQKRERERAEQLRKEEQERAEQQKREEQARAEQEKMDAFSRLPVALKRIVAQNDILQKWYDSFQKDTLHKDYEFYPNYMEILLQLLKRIQPLLLALNRFRERKQPYEVYQLNEKIDLFDEILLDMRTSPDTFSVSDFDNEVMVTLFDTTFRSLLDLRAELTLRFRVLQAIFTKPSGLTEKQTREWEVIYRILDHPSYMEPNLRGGRGRKGTSTRKKTSTRKEISTRRRLRTPHKKKLNQTGSF